MKAERLSGWFLRFARLVAWLAVPLFLIGSGSAIWLGQQYATNLDLTIFWGLGAFAVVGAFLIAWRPYHRVSWILVTIGLMAGVCPATETYAAYVMTTQGLPNPLVVLGVWLNAWYWYLLLALIMFYLPLFFPDGRLPSSRWWPLLLVGTIGTEGIMLLGMLSDTLIGQTADYQLDNPIGLAAISTDPENSNPLFEIFGIFFALGILGAAASVVVRFRRSRGGERQQMKWFLFAVAIVVSIPLLDILSLLQFVPELGQDIIFGFGLFASPTSIAFAILRYRLYDIDLIIRKTLIYVLLTTALAVVFFGSVILLQSIVSALSGQHSALATVLSTLAIVALFNSLRQRIQNLIDRRFYRRKYDAQQVLAAFAQTARDETDLDALTGELGRVVEKAMQPELIMVWLRPTNEEI